MFTGTKPTVPDFHFGQIGLFYHIRKENGIQQRAEPGIFLSYGSHHRYIRAYLP